MTIYEFMYSRVLIHFFPLYLEVNRQLKYFTERAKLHDYCLTNILDVAGRRSQYTSGIDAQITLLDKCISLEDMNKICNRRSNIKYIQTADATKIVKGFNGRFDIIVCVEFLEHIKDTENLIKNLYDYLRPGGVLILTTPNGEFVQNTNPEHVRHYEEKDLRCKFGKVFGYANIGVKRICTDYPGRHYAFSSWSIKRPLKTIRSMFCGFVGRFYKPSNDSYEHNLLLIAKKSEQINVFKDERNVS